MKNATQKAASTAKTKNQTTPENDPGSDVPVLNPNMTLYEISKEYTGLEELLDGIEGEIAPDDKTKILAFLEQLDGSRDKKLDAICGLIRDRQARAEARKKEADRFTKLAKYDENKVNRLKWVILNFLEVHDLKSVETMRFRPRIATNSAAPVLVDEKFVNNPELLEERFFTTDHKLNNRVIAQALKDGEKLEFARFGEKGKRLVID